MNWDAIGAVGEWAGAIAVVLTLFYLAIQIRQQNQIAKHQAWQHLLDSFNQSLMLTASDPAFAELNLKAQFSPHELTDAEASQFQAGIRTYHNNMLIAYRAYQAGFLEETDWLQLAQTFHGYLCTPGGEIFREGQGIFSDFWVAVDEAASKDGAKVDWFLGRRSDGT